MGTPFSPLCLRSGNLTSTLVDVDSGFIREDTYTITYKISKEFNWFSLPFWIILSGTTLSITPPDNLEISTIY